jgi:Fic family protein
MDFKKLFQKRDLLNKNINKLNKESLENYELDFEIKFSHESTAIEGNTLSLMETKILLEDKISIRNKNLREIYEVVNNSNAWNYTKNNINQDLNKNFNEFSAS